MEIACGREKPWSQYERPRNIDHDLHKRTTRKRGQITNKSEGMVRNEEDRRKKAGRRWPNLRIEG
jgi:hypothetical protein